MAILNVVVGLGEFVILTRVVIFSRMWSFLFLLMVKDYLSFLVLFVCHHMFQPVANLRVFNCSDHRTSVVFIDSVLFLHGLFRFLRNSYIIRSFIPASIFFLLVVYSVDLQIYDHLPTI